jgi:hypothetical protein
MKKKRKTKKVWVFVSLGILIISLVIWQFVKYDIVYKQVFRMVAEKSNGLYKIKYEDLLIDEVRGTLSVKNIEISADTGVYYKMVLAKNDPSIILNLKIPSLEISGIKTPKALLNKKIDGRKIDITNPSIEIEIGGTSKDSTINSPAPEIYKELLGQLLSVKIGQVQINNADLIVKNLKTHSVEFSGKDVSFLLSDLLIDSVANQDHSRILFSRDLEATCQEIFLPSRNDKYKLFIQQLKFTSGNNSFAIGKINFVPQLSEEKFAASFPTQKDRYNFSLEGIELKNINRDGLWHKRLEADSLRIKKSSFKIYHDLSYPHDTSSQVGNYPQEQLMRMPLLINIKETTLESSFIEYKEKNAKSDSSGKVQFYNVHATIHNITNIPGAIRSNNSCVVNFVAKFLNNVIFKAKLKMILKDPKGKFSIQGDLGSISGSSLNALSQPMSLTRIEKGKVNGLHFDFTGNDSASDGEVTLLYDNVRISLLKKNKNENKYAKKILPSLLAYFILKNANPFKNEKVRVESVHYKRDLKGSFVNLMWKSLFTGVKQTLGVK